MGPNTAARRLIPRCRYPVKSSTVHAANPLGLLVKLLAAHSRVRPSASVCAWTPRHEEFGVLCTQRIARTVASAAMPKRLDQIRTTIPLCALICLANETCVLEEQGLPRPEKRALTERKTHLVGGRTLRYRLQTFEIRIESRDIGISQLRIGGIRKHGIQMLAVRTSSDRKAAENCDSDQLPIPVVRSGVMLVE